MSEASVSLVPFDRRHLEATRAWANDPELARFLDRGRPVGELEHQRWYEGLQGRADCVFFAIETTEAGKHVGNVWLWDICTRHRRAELRIVMGESGARGKGVGGQAIDMATRFAFERLNLHKVYAYVLDSNPRAVRAFEKTGYEREGLLRRDRWLEKEYIDVHLLARFR